MKGRTHKATGVLSSVSSATLYYNMPNLIQDFSLPNIITLATIVGMGSFGALLPDIDHPKAKLGRHLPFLGQYIVSHRGFTHTFYFMIAMYLAINFLLMNAVVLIATTSAVLGWQKILIGVAILLFGKFLRKSSRKFAASAGIKKVFVLDLIGFIFDLLFFYGCYIIGIVIFGLFYGEVFGEAGLRELFTERLKFLPQIFTFAIFIHLMGDASTIQGINPLKLNINFLKPFYFLYYKLTKRNAPSLESPYNQDGKLYIAEKVNFRLSWIYLTPNSSENAELWLEKFCYLMSLFLLVGFVGREFWILGFVVSGGIVFFGFLKKLISR